MTDSVNAMKTIIILAGGTGGHIAPGVALAHELKKLSVNPIILSSTRNVDYGDFQKGELIVRYYNPPAIRLRSPSVILLPFRYLAALLHARSLFRREKADAVVGMGGYTTFPALSAAVITGIPVYVCDQNAVPGKVTAIFGRYARRVFLSMPDITNRLTQFREKLMIAGNPLRRDIIVRSGKKAEGKKGKQTKTEESIFGKLEKASGRKNALRILVVGGSQGAVQLNEMTTAALEHVTDAVWALQCGIQNLEKMKRALPEERYPYIHTFGFHNDIHELYESCDVILCRAGAGVVTEAGAFGLPMILVPYPYAADNHQKANAEVFADAGGAFLIDQKSTDAGPLIDFLEQLKSKDLRLKMGQKNRELVRISAGENIASTILEDITAGTEARA